ncbi:MAG: stalk domain-containing protein [Oscillospiraceae bacterium]|jgi:D-alanyl-D-alanine carboxypeptidase
MKLGKKFTVLLLTAALVCSLAPTAFAAPDPVTYAAADLLYNVTTGETYYAKNADTLRNPASIVKLMTAYMVYDAIAAGTITKKSPVTISAHAAAIAADPEAANVPLVRGQSYTVDELLSATLVVSACGAACALGEKLSGTESAFAASMTARAQANGWNMRFSDASGLDGNSRATARSLALLSSTLLTKYPDVLSYTARTSCTFRGKTYRTTNYLLPGGTYAYSGADGLKTGTLSTAGKCLVATAARKSQRLVAVVLGGGSDDVRFGDAIRMLDNGFARSTYPTLTRSNARFTVDGTAAPIHAYVLEGRSFVCLRDLSAALAASGNGYSINWNASTNIITLTTGGSAAAMTGDCPATASVPKGTAPFVINGSSASVESYTVNGVTYADLRALAPALGFEIGYDGATNTIALKVNPATWSRTQKCTLDGREITLNVYLIHDTGYYKLRDVASVMSGTAKQFDVGWDGASNTIALKSGVAYTPVGGELAMGDGALRFAQATSAAVTLDGQRIAPAAYNIGGNNYFRLRDLGALLGFGVDWDASTGTVVLTSGAATPSPSPTATPTPSPAVTPLPSPEMSPAAVSPAA